MIEFNLKIEDIPKSLIFPLNLFLVLITFHFFPFLFAQDFSTSLSRYE